MKKTLIITALCSGIVTVAHAQSSVTLYGLIDAGVTYTNNQHGHSAWQQSSGADNGGRWGLRGAEDLGDGMKALFVLESGFNINNGSTGQNGRIFGRQAFVGLSHNEYGSLTVGRQYDSVVDYLGPLSLTGGQYGGTQFAHPFDNDNLNDSFRISNAVKYQSVDYNGLKLGALYAFSNSTSFSNNRAYSVGVSYSYQGLHAAAAYLQVNNDVNALSLDATDAGAVAGDWTFAAGRQRVWGTGLNYTYGPATAGFVFTQTSLNDSRAISAGQSGVAGGITGLSGTTRFNNYEVNARYAVTPAISLAGSYTYTDGHLAGQNPSWNQFNVQAAYALSQRTELYVQGEFQKVNANGLDLGADIIGVGSASSSNKQVAVTAGMRHVF